MRLSYILFFRSLSLIVETNDFDNGRSTQENEGCVKQLLLSSWCGLLSALSLLLDASTDDSTTETILKHLVKKTFRVVFYFIMKQLTYQC